MSFEPPRSRSATFLSLVLALSATFVRAQPMPQKRMVVTGAEARNRLSGSRQELLKSLQRESSRPVEIALDSESGAVLLLRARLQAGPGGLKDREALASRFLSRYGPLLDFLECGD